MAEYGARIDPRFFAETADWPLAAKLLYLYFICAQGSDGITGVCHQTDMVLRAELGFSQKQFQTATNWLKMREKVAVYPGDWYWVIRRPAYTLLTGDGQPYRNAVLAVAKFLSQRQIPSGLVKDFLAHYGRIFEVAKVQKPRVIDWRDPSVLKLGGKI